MMVPLCDCAEMRPHGDLLQSMNRSEYTVEGICMDLAVRKYCSLTLLGVSRCLWTWPASPHWCRHVDTLCHVLDKEASAGVLSIAATQIQENTHDISLLEDGKEGGPPIYSLHTAMIPSAGSPNQ